MYKFLFCLPLFFCIKKVYAQTPPSIEWGYSYGFDLSDISFDILLTSDSGFVVVVGSTELEGINCGNYSDTSNYWITKLNQFGLLEWEKSYGGSEHDEAISIQVTQDQGFFVLGTSSSNDGDLCFSMEGDSCGIKGEKDIWLIKLDSMGNIEWEKSYGGSRDDTATGILVNSNGGYTIVGSTFSDDKDVNSGQGSLSKTWIISIDDYGTIIEEKSFWELPPLNYNESSRSVITTRDFGYIICGNTWRYNPENNATYAEMYIRKLSNDSNLEWHATYGGGLDDVAYDIVQTSDYGYIIIGSTKSVDGDISHNSICSDDEFANQNHYNCRDFWIVKIDSTGNLLYDLAYGGNSSDVAYNILSLNDPNEYLVIGQSSSIDEDMVGINIGANDISLVKIIERPDSFIIDWKLNLGSSRNDGIFTALQLLDSSYVIAAFSDGSDYDIQENFGCRDFWITKLSYNCINNARPLKPELFGDSIVCKNDEIVLTTFSIVTDNIEYKWITPTGVITTSEPELIIDSISFEQYSGDYSLIIEVGGCPSPISDIISIEVLPITKIDTTICQGESIVFNGEVYSEAGIYNLSPPSNISCDSIIQLDLSIFLPSEPKCASFFISLNPLITPNDDGYNDILYFEGLDQYSNNSIRIFNRYGQLVYEASPYKNDWDGTYKETNEILPDGTYYYFLNMEEGVKNIKGYITILSEGNN